MRECPVFKRDPLTYAGVAGEYAYDERHDLKQSAVTVFTFKGKDDVALKSL